MAQLEPRAFDAQKISSLVRSLGGQVRPSDEQPPPKGYLDSIAKIAIGKVTSSDLRLTLIALLTHNAHIWEVIGGGGVHSAGKSLDRVAVEPPPIPWRQSFSTAFAEAVVERAELIDHVASSIGVTKGKQSAASAFIAQFTDDYCGNGLVIRIPHIGPHHIDGSDLIVTATHFADAAKQTANKALGAALAQASEKLAETGYGRL